MIRYTVKNCGLYSLVLPFSLNMSNSDVVSKDMKTISEADLSAIRNETGWERLKKLFQKDDFGRISSELHSIFQTACLSSFIGGMYGGIVNSREAYLDFMKNNQATAFRNHLEAKKKLQDQVMVSFGKGAFKWGWRLTIFSTMYISISTSIAVYRGKNGILEHIIAGGLAGTLYKFKMGPRGWIVGGGLGLALGGFAGVLTTSLLKLTGMTMEEIRYWNYKWMDKRSEIYNRELKKHLDREELAMLTEREIKLTNAVLDSIDVEANVNTKVNNNSK